MKFRRRQYINDPGYQMKIVIVFVVITLLVNIVSIGVFNYIALQQMEDVIWSTHINVKTTGEIINSLFVYINIINLFVISLLFILMGNWMLRKTVTPLMRMSGDINRMTEGDLVSAIALEKKDVFQDVASEIDNLRKSMRDQFKSISGQHHEMSGSIKNLSLLTGQSERLTSESGIILGKINKLEQEIGKLKL